MKQADQTLSILNQHLRYLLALRSIAIGTQVLALIFMYYNFSLHFPILPITLIIFGLTIYTLYSWWHLRANPPIQNRIFFIQLLVDVIALTLLVYFTGGSTNPFIFFFLLPITFAAATLNFKQTCFIAGTAALSYTLLMFFHVPLLQQHQHNEGFDLHIWGMWYGFLISAGLVAYFVSRIGHGLRKRDRALAAAREENLRADQVLALGTLAAGTAHELGTPLSTMAVLTKEMEHDYDDNEELVANLRLLRSQIDRCKGILSRMAINAGEAHAESGHRVRLDEYLNELVAEWTSLRPDIHIFTRVEGTTPAPELIAEQTLGQAINNVLNNAADASREKVEFHAHWDQEEIRIEVCDDGLGFDEALKNKLGQPIDSQKKPDGLGIGLFLAQLTLNRLGGHAEISNRPEGGSRTLITIPLRELVTD